MALNEAKNEAIFLRALLQDLGETQKVPSQMIIINGDNQGSLDLAKNAKFHKRSKHIETKYHSIREMVNKGVVAVQYCSTSDMVADVFTKPTSAPIFAKHCGMMLSPNPELA
jgi:hypothetical protein